MAHAPHFPDVTDITDLPALVTWSGLAGAAWTATSETLGTVPSIRVLAYMPPAALTTATAAARVTIPAQGEPGTEDHVPATTRALTPVEVTQVGLLWQAAQQLTSRPVVDPFGPTGPPPVLGVVGGGAPAVDTQAGEKETKRKIKCCQVLDQSDEAEIPELKQKEIDGFYNRLREVKGGPVRPECEPSPEQISALKVRILELDLAPYADFGIFVNFQHRFSKALKFLNHILQPDGTFRAVEVPGPPSYEQWLSSWKVFENTLLMFQTEAAPGVMNPIVTPSALEEYKDAFRDMVVNYPEAWHLLVKAEDRCRGEHFPRLRRNLLNRFNKGLAPEFDPSMPWDGVFGEAARDRDYWDENPPSCSEQPQGKGAIRREAQVQQRTSRRTKKVQRRRRRTKVRKNVSRSNSRRNERKGPEATAPPHPEGIRRANEDQRGTRKGGSSRTDPESPFASPSTTGNAKGCVAKTWCTFAKIALAPILQRNAGREAIIERAMSLRVLSRKGTRRVAPLQAKNIKALHPPLVMSRVERENLQSCSQGLPASHQQWPGFVMGGPTSCHPTTSSTGRTYRTTRSLSQWQNKPRRTYQTGSTLLHPAEHTQRQGEQISMER